MSGPTRGPGRDAERFEELAAVYALGALTGEERLWFEAYLAEHPELNAEVEELGSVANLLALAPPEQEPPPGLRRSVLERVGAPREVVSGMADRRSRRAERMGRLLRPGALAAAAAAFVAVIGLLVWNLTLQDQNGELRAQNGDLQGEIAERRAVEMEGSGLASNAGGEVLLMEEDRAVLVASQLPPAPEGKVYETWIIRDGMPEPAGLFEPRNGEAASTVEGSVEDAEVIAVTLEPEGGSPMPTSEPILVAELA
ncbi:MAG: anti-sigma factor [Actinobacteria bacterium]|nr:MAG: anti-sigma factor [Actinomycetota bacterium]